MSDEASGPDGSGGAPSDADVVEAAAAAAEGVVRSRYKQSEILDLDVTATFEDGRLDVDVYVDAPDDPDPAVVANEAVEAAEAAVDDLFADA